MAIRTVVTRGYGNGTFSGTIALVTTRGYAIGEAAVVVPGPYFIDASQGRTAGAVAMQGRQAGAVAAQGGPPS